MKNGSFFKPYLRPPKHISDLLRKENRRRYTIYRKVRTYSMYKIVSKRPLNPTVCEMVVSAPLVAKKVKAGQFIILRVDEDGERIPLTVADYDRAYAIYPSPSNAVTYCQANFKLMGADLVETAKHFGKRIAFIHVRDVEGDKTDFTELFHDQGTTDQFALMRTYRELGLDVPVRGDHVPEMEGDGRIAADSIPGYSTLGRLFANGYLKALLKGTEA